MLRPGAWRAESRGSLRGMYTTCAALRHRVPREWRARHGHKGAVRFVILSKRSCAAKDLGEPREASRPTLSEAEGFLVTH